MRTTLPPEELGGYLKSQLQRLFPDGRPARLRKIVRRALERVEYAFERIVLPGYSDRGEATFSHLHGDQYASFLYFAANTAWREHEDVPLASKIFLLNKALNGIVIVYDTILPDVFVLMHTVGTVLGKAQYGNYLVAAQNVTVGMDRGETPVLGERVVLYGGSVVIGRAQVGDRVTIATNATVRGQDVPSGHVAAGASPNLVVRPAGRDVSTLYFG